MTTKIKIADYLRYTARNEHLRAVDQLIFQLCGRRTGVTLEQLFDHQKLTAQVVAVMPAVRQNPPLHVKILRARLQAMRRVGLIDYSPLLGWSQA